MKLITTVLRESEATAVRKAVCMAGAERVVIISIPLLATNHGNLNVEQPTAQSGMHVRMEVTAADIHYGGIVSAIQRVVQAGKIALDSRHDMLPVRPAHVYNSLI